MGLSPLGARGSVRGPLAGSPVALGYKIWGPWGNAAPYPNEAAIPLASVAECWQPKPALSSLFPNALATDLASSKVGIAHGGGLAQGGTGTTVWTSGSGWTFSTTNYFATSLLPNQSYSMFVQFSDAVSYNYYMCTCGTYQAGKYFALFPTGSPADNNKYFSRGSTEKADAPKILSGNVALVASTGYENGLPLVTFLPATFTATSPININAPGPGIERVQCLLVLNDSTIPNANQVANITYAMGLIAAAL